MRGLKKKIIAEGAPAFGELYQGDKKALLYQIGVGEDEEPDTGFFSFEFEGTDFSFSEIDGTGITIDFGDGYVSQGIEKTHTYTDPGPHTIKVYGFLRAFSLYGNTGILKILTRFRKNAIINFSSMLLNCQRLSEIPSDLFSVCKYAKRFEGCFYGCASLMSIPSGLFDHNEAVTNFAHCFDGCKSLTPIPAGLFEHNAAVTNFAYCFAGNTSLTSIPSGIFDNCTKVTSFQRCFTGCTSLGGLAPELWDTSKWPNVTSYTRCFYNCTGLTNYADIPSGWK